MFHRTDLFCSCSQYYCRAEHGSKGHLFSWLRPSKAGLSSSPAFTCHLLIQDHSLGTATQMALRVKSALRLRDAEITTDNPIIVTRPFPLRQKPRTSILNTQPCKRKWKGWIIHRLPIPVAQGEWGRKKGNQHQWFIQCSLLKPLTVAEKLINSIWAWRPL